MVGACPSQANIDDLESIFMAREYIVNLSAHVIIKADSRDEAREKTHKQFFHLLKNPDINFGWIITGIEIHGKKKLEAS